MHGGFNGVRERARSLASDGRRTWRALAVGAAERTPSKILSIRRIHGGELKNWYVLGCSRIVKAYTDSAGWIFYKYNKVTRDARRLVTSIFVTLHSKGRLQAACVTTRELITLTVSYALTSFPLFILYISAASRGVRKSSVGFCLPGKVSATLFATGN